MTHEMFCYWLQGFAEITRNPPTDEQWQQIKEHLQTTFLKVTPQMPIYSPHLPMGPIGPAIC